MSLNKSATRRVSLLAGSSLFAATLATAAFTGAVMAPGAALAANECAPIGVAPSANGNTADTYVCTGATAYQTTGVTYTSQGNLTVGATGAMDVGTVGINLIGTTTDNVVFTANGTLTGASGAVVDIKTASGNITATVAGLEATAGGVTNGVRLESTGAGNITFTRTVSFGNSAPINNTAAGAEAAVMAKTNGGNITLTIPTQAPTATGGGVVGHLRGILAETSGGGAVVLNVSGLSGITNNPTAGVAVIDIKAGTGGVDINLTSGAHIGGLLVLQGEIDRDLLLDALAIRVASAGAVTIDNTRGRVLGSVDFSGVTAGGVRFDSTLVGTGAIAGGGVYAAAGNWHMSGNSIFSSQNDLVIMGGTRASHRTAPVATVDFGAGNDTFNMSGMWLVSDVTISNLEAFNNSGTIFMGGSVKANTADPQRSDDRADDRLTMSGVTFTGSGTSRVIFDVVLNGAEQVGCANLTGAGDCLDLRDSTTAGSTIVQINDASADAMLSGYAPNGITLIDVSGGTTDPAHFTLDPAVTEGYVSPLYGPAIDRPGAFVYVFRYDAENQRYVLVSQPKDRNLFDYAVLSGAAQSIWHMTTETVTDRQGELRRRGGTRSLWMRTSGEYTKRDISTEFEGFDDTYAFDNSYKLYAGTITGGVDLITGTSGDYDYVLGAQLGYVGSSLDLNASDTSGKFTGATGGLYGSVWSDGMFLDATFNLNGLALDFVSPALASKTTTYTNSVGARLDGGMRWMLGERTFLEPLATLAFARTTFEEISLSVGEVQPAVANSRRGALGLRVGADLTEGPINVGYFVTGRAWDEFAGDNDGVVHNPGVDMPFSDAFTGGFGEAEAGVSFFNDDGTLSGSVSVGTKFKDGYSATDFSLGVRARW